MDENEVKFDNSLPESDDDDNKENEKIFENIINLISKTYLKKVEIGVERPVEESDFIVQKENLVKNFTQLYDLLVKNLNNDNENKFLNLKKSIKENFTINLLLLCGEHLDFSYKNVWTTKETVKFSNLVIELLYKSYSYSSIEELLNDRNNNHLLPLLFNKLKPKLLKDRWKFFPAAVSSYVWIVCKIQMPNMGSLLHLVMPTILILLDDYVTVNRITGLNCLHHVIKNVTKTELLWYCEGDILYKTLEPMMYNLEPELLKPLINCLIMVISKNLSVEDQLKWTHYDDVMKIWLPSIEMEQKLALRSVHMDCLPVFLQSMGLSCVRWSKRIIRIFEEYAAIPVDREKCFRVMFIFISVTWPRTINYFSKIIIIILKSLTDVINDKNTISDNDVGTVNSIVDCIKILSDVLPDEMEKLRCDIINCEQLNDSFKIFFKS